MASDELIAVADVWHRAGIAEYRYLPTWQAFPQIEARRVFRDVIAPRCEIWVAVDAGVVVGYMALDGSYLDRLYVDPAHQRRGFGLALLNQAMRHRPAGLELHTHQANQRARAFYEGHGFKAVRFGISAPGGTAMKELGITADAVVAAAQSLG